MASKKAKLSFVEENYRIKIDVSFLHQTHINNVCCNLLKNHHQRNIKKDKLLLFLTIHTHTYLSVRVYTLGQVTFALFVSSIIRIGK